MRTFDRVQWAMTIGSLVVITSGIALFPRVQESLADDGRPKPIGVRPTAEHVRDAIAASPDDAVPDTRAENRTSVRSKSGACCFAGSTIEDPHALGGFADSKNDPKPVEPGAKGKGLFLLAQPEVVVTCEESAWMRLVLVNRTDDLLRFSASDSRLAIVQEAKDEDGAWRPIEFVPSSWCGNSGHSVFLEPDHFWEFPVPRYEGERATKIRFAFDLGGGLVLTSNEFDGSVNPGQFGERRENEPGNLMDPTDG